MNNRQTTTKHWMDYSETSDRCQLTFTNGGTTTNDKMVARITGKKQTNINGGTTIDRNQQMNNTQRTDK